MLGSVGEGGVVVVVDVDVTVADWITGVDGLVILAEEVTKAEDVVELVGP